VNYLFGEIDVIPIQTGCQVWRLLQAGSGQTEPASDERKEEAASVYFFTFVLH